MTIDPILVTADEHLLESFVGVSDPDRLPSAILVDWETRRHEMTSVAGGTDDADSHDDLQRVVGMELAPVICRLNALGPDSEAEIELAVAMGASEVLLPMVRTVEEAQEARRLVPDGVGFGLMVETRDAVEHCSDFVGLGIDRAFIGLLDLAIETGAPGPFTALIDGSVEKVVEVLGGCTQVGVGGLTRPGGGSPIPGRLLMGELVRLGCGFSFMRRTFISDLDGLAPPDAVREVRMLLAALAHRSGDETDADREDFVGRVSHLYGATR